MSETRSRENLRAQCSKLASDADRWIEELRVYGIRPTLGAGMILKCSRCVEDITRHCASLFLSTAGDKGEAVLATFERGGVEKLTLGSLIRLLREVVSLDECSPWKSILTDRQSWAALDFLCKTRNRIVHSGHSEEDAATWIAYLETAKSVSSNGVVQAAMALEEARTERT